MVTESKEKESKQGQQQKQKMTPDQMVSHALALFNRAHNHASAEAEAALLNVANQLFTLDKQYQELVKTFQQTSEELKQLKEAASATPNGHGRIGEPKDYATPSLAEEV